MKHLHFPVKKLDTIVSANGAGDTFLGAFISGLLQYKNEEEVEQLTKAVNLGSRCSALTIMSTENVSPSINPSLLQG